MSSEFSELREVLDAAYEQAASGKGDERHGHGAPLEAQPVFRLMRDHGIGFATGQASKKAVEALSMDDPEAAERELLGAIVYLAFAILEIRK